MTKPTKTEVHEFQTKALVEFELTLTYAEAEKMLEEVSGEESARNRK